MPIDRWRGCAVAAAALLMVGTLPAMAQDAATIAAQGNGKGAAPCQTCHAPDGSGQASGGFPRLAGENAAYLQAQLEAFASGARDNPVMKLQAGALTEAERKALAIYFSKMPAVAAPDAAGTTPFADPEHLGETLATRGRWSKQEPACEQCHGPGGVGVGADFPPLAGQSANYLASQLRAFRSGSRHNDPMGLMRNISHSLSDQDIDAVAHWFAAQPFPPKGARP